MYVGEGNLFPAFGLGTVPTDLRWVGRPNDRHIKKPRVRANVGGMFGPHPTQRQDHHEPTGPHDRATGALLQWLLQNRGAFSRVHQIRPEALVRTGQPADGNIRG
jgi:hypothetical protein